MLEQRSNRPETEAVARVDSMLGLLGDLSKRDPHPGLRDRLTVLASQRLNRNRRHLGRRSRIWLKPAIQSACLIAVGIAMAMAVHFYRPEPVKNSQRVKASPPRVSEKAGTHSVPPEHESVARLSRVQRSRHTPRETTGPQQMTMRLPYSNSAIETGTGTTIRVSMSQSELLSLGFPINATVQDRRIVAELTLGDDGLPRAISLPLPLEAMKENK